MRFSYVFGSALLLMVVAQGLALAAEPGDALAKQSTIRRDSFGVPHILAQTEEAAAFANGYVAAEDHGLEIARLYLKARSREAAWFGKGFADPDFRMKLFGLHDAAAEGYAKSPEWMRQILDGYAAGFNRYFEQHRADTPKWVEPVRGVDVLAHAMRVVNFEFAMDSDQLSLAARASAPPAPGSNMFAVNQERSASGHAMLLGNPHLAWFGSQVWHEIHITVPGVINAYGASLIGLPGIEIGFNERLGWSHTVNEFDATDVYELRLAPGDRESYVFDGKPRKLIKRELAVDVLVDGKIRQHTQIAFASHLGPIVRFAEDKAYALKTPNFGAYRSLEQWSLMSKARTLDEFKATLELQGISMFNIAYADADGNCFYICNGRFPKRPAGHDWSGIVPGDSSATEWTEILSVAELPQLSNPKGGYVHNSNNAPWYTSLAAPIDKAQFPPDLFPDANDWRSQLGLRMIDSDASLSFDEMLANKLNTHLLAADRLKDALIAAARPKASADPLLEQAIGVLEQWDNSAARDSRGGVLFVAFAQAYLAKAAKPFAQDWDPAHFMDAPSGLGEPALAVEQLAAAAKSVRDRFGSLDVPWGEVYRLRLGDGDLPLGGYEDELGAYRVIYFQRDTDDKMKALGGDSYIFAVEFSQPLRAVSVLPYGQSADPKSPHHEDQAALFADGQFKDVWFSEAAIAAHTERSYQP